MSSEQARASNSARDSPPRMVVQAEASSTVAAVHTRRPRTGSMVRLCMAEKIGTRVPRLTPFPVVRRGRGAAIFAASSGEIHSNGAGQ